MKFLIISLVSILSLVVLSAQEHEKAFIEFDKVVHDFGEIATDKLPDGRIRFYVYNKGKEPLILTSVRACCGTVVNYYTRSPISARDTGFVEVQFRIAQMPHRISRSVTIQSNASNQQTSLLRIIGNVVEPTGFTTRSD